MILKNFGSPNTLLFICFISFLGIFCPLHGNSIGIESRFTPSEITQGQVANYSVEISGAIPYFVQLPDVSGLEVLSQQTYQSTQILNGSRFVKTTYKFAVLPQNAGQFEIPEFSITIDDQEYTVPPAKLSVVADSNSKSIQKNEYVTLKVSSDLKSAYIGQNIPIKMEISLQNNVELLSNILSETADSSFLQPIFVNQPILNRSKNQSTYTWDGIVQAIKTGDHSFQIKTTFPVEILRSLGIFSTVQQEIMKLTSDPLPLEIFQLENKPKNFSGAIGNFSFKNLKISSDRALVGEPITLSVELFGEGNFLNSKPPQLFTTPEWKILPSKVVKSNLDELNNKGSQTFEFVLIPQKTGIVKLPKITFTYFDPASKSFKTLKNKLPEVKEVLVSRSSDSHEFLSQSSQKDSSEIFQKDKKNGDKTQNALPPSGNIILQDGINFKNLTPICYSVGYKVYFSVLILIVTFYSIWKFLRSKSSRQLQIKKEIKHNKSQLYRHIQRKELKEFFSLARSTLLAVFKRNNVDCTSYSKLYSSLELKKVPSSLILWLQNFLQEADAIQFGHQNIDESELKFHMDQISQLIDFFNK